MVETFECLLLFIIIRSFILNLFRYGIRFIIVFAKEMAEDVGISTREIEENIKKLKSRGLLERVDPPKEGYWKMIK